ncbi:regulatory subunit of protein phosphatase PP4 [Saccharomyces cerevisiae]|nr:regulatory subunit of protein phosphatase PP4 [Saccharomyces cerevisiae]
MSSTMLDDVDNNMMGIKSISLYELLSDVVKQGDKTRLVTAGPEQVLPDLIRHITETIPFDLFINLKNEMNDARNLVTRLNWLGKFLNDNFLQNHTFPFTILRICELCYDPFKYYKINELEKFVNALEKCCMLAPFIREIDSIMSVNLGYDDEDEEEGFFDGDEDREMGNKSKRNVLLKDENFMVEEYYEDDCGINDDNSDNKGQNCQSDVTKNNSDDEDDDDNDDDYREDGADEDDEDDDHMGSTDDDEDDDEDRQAGESTKVQNFDKKNETPRKRKPTDLDNFEYDESPSFTNMDLTTPKKYKHTATGRFSIIESPSSSLLNAMDGSNEISSSQEEEKEDAHENHEGRSEGLLPGDELVSPSMSSSQEDKMVAIAGITYRENISSPLGKKSR